MPMDQNTALDLYLGLIFPWDPANQNLWKCVTWSFHTTDDKGAPKKGFANFAAQDLAGVKHLITTRAGKVNTDVYIALGAERMAELAKKTRDGYPKAIRQNNNVVSHNAIFLDIDVGKANGYATMQDAVNALDDFIETVGLPDPTMEIHSGGGLHVYWCTKDPIPIGSWNPLAAGLRDAALAYKLQFDPQCTVNPAIVLRPPGTWNHKTVPPKPVFLDDANSSFNLYDYQQLVGALTGYVGPTMGMRVVQQSAQSSQRTQNFTANVGVAAPVGLDDVIRACPVIEDIAQRGGNGDPEPLWNQAILLASFLEDSVVAAHRLSSGDPRYTQAETDKKLHEKLTARAQNQNIGWPKCAQFSPLHPACQTCPLFAHGKSPLNFSNKLAPAVPATPVGSTDELMPAGYWRDPQQHVCTTLTNPKTGAGITVDVLKRPILDAGIDKDSGFLVFRTRLPGLEKWGYANVAGNLQANALAEELAAHGLYVTEPRVAKDFIVAWMTHLQDIRRTVTAEGYGWTKDGKGFVFDQTIYKATGKDTVFRGVTTDNRFVASGELKPWQDAMQLVYGNPSLETVTASAFAAPLVDLISPGSVVVSVFSDKSGIGKTTSLSLAQAVWGDPRAGMSALSDTANSLDIKVGALRHLPVYWDELRTAEHVDKVVEIVFQITQGKGKSKLKSDSTQRHTPVFTTMFTVASNYGITDNIYSRTDGTEAGGLRVFEIEALQRQSSAFANIDAMNLLKGIETNYGKAGEVYAELLVKHRDVIKTSLSDRVKELNSRHSLTDKERFWAVTYATLLVGAQLANHAGLTRFDIPAIDACLSATLAKMRATLSGQAYSTLSSSTAGEGILGDIMSSIMGKHLLITDVIHYSQIAGRAPLVNASETGDLSRLTDVWMQMGSKDGKVRMRTKQFNKWARDRKLQPEQILKLFDKDYVVQRGRQPIGAGVPFLDASSRYRSECIDLTPLIPPGASHGSS